MSEGFTTPDLVELTRRSLDAVNRRDLDTLMSFSAPDAVYDTSPSGLGVYEGQAAIRAFIKGYWDAFAELRFDLEELVDLGNGVTFSVNRQDARPVGSTARVRTREAHLTEWVQGLVVKMTVYTDIDEGREAAQRLAASRGQAMSRENMEVVRRVMRRFADQNIGAALEDIDPDAELDWSKSDAPDSGVYTGHAAWRAFAQARDEALGHRRFDPVELVAPAADTVVLVGRMREQGRASGVEVEAGGAAVWTLRDGKVVCLKIYQSGEEALKAVEPRVARREAQAARPHRRD